MNKLNIILISGMLIAGGCSSGNLEVRNGPQTQSPYGDLAQSSSIAVTQTVADSCGSSQFQSLVGGPSSAVTELNIPGDSRHYGRNERVETNTPSRLNFVHSGTAVDSVINPKSTVLRVFCG